MNHLLPRPATLNVANEVAVHAFADDRIPFTGIVPLVAEVARARECQPVVTLEEAPGRNRWGRRQAQESLGTKESRVR